MNPLLFKNLVILLSRIFSNIFAKTGRRDIGRSLLSDLGVETLGVGITYAILKISGKVSCRMHLLNSFVNVGNRTHFDNFTNLGGISSIPLNDAIFILSMSEFTSSLIS